MRRSQPRSSNRRQPLTDQQPTAHANAQRAYHQRQRAKGLTKLSVYVPEEERDAFYQTMELLRVQWRKRGHDV